MKKSCALSKQQKWLPLRSLSKQELQKVIEEWKNPANLQEESKIDVPLACQPETHKTSMQPSSARGILEPGNAAWLPADEDRHLFSEENESVLLYFTELQPTA